MGRKGRKYREIKSVQIVSYKHARNYLTNIKKEMEIDKITRQHVLDAVENIETENIELEPSTIYDVRINDKLYPPKEVMRYANLLANSTKEWPYSGGDSTNKYLRGFGFEIVNKEPEDTPATHEALIEIVKKAGREAASFFFEKASLLIEELNVKQNDKRVTYGTRSDKRLSITIGQRYCFAIVPKRKLPWIFICDIEIPSTENIRVEKYEGDPIAYYYHCRNSDEINLRFSEIINASRKELIRTEISSYRKFNNELFEKAIFDTDFREHLFNEAFGKEFSLTGNVWKLGCNWAKGGPVFYDLVKKRSFTIAISDKLYSVGDLVILTIGQTAHALGKVLEVPSPVINYPELQQEFEQYKIDFDANVFISKVEWYELAEDERFTYLLQQGNCRVHGYYRETAIKIWHDRFINYWVFQGNPSAFDFKTALKENLLQNWMVNAHRDKIKKDDKAIIWFTGKNAGCYALAKITSNPEESINSPDAHLWKEKPANSITAGIELTHNLMANPLLWQQIKNDDDLAGLKVGSQGTNFTATRKQYNTILSLIDKNIPAMINQIELSINTILYGPPGTGKTFELNKYKEQYFTDRGVSKTMEEELKEKIPDYPYWKILAAVLNTFDHLFL